MVLYVEDDPTAARLLQIVLRDVRTSRIAELLVASNAREALAFLNHQAAEEGGRKTNLMVLDLHLPARSGLSLLKEIRENEVLAELPVIIFSSSQISEEREQAFALGALDFIYKSPDLSGFYNAAEAICANLRA